MYIRKATIDDLPQLMEIFACAKEIMRASGNHSQWGEGYPSTEIVQHDICSGVCYVVCNEQNDILATMAFIDGPDPTYSIIEGGEWLNDNPYCVIHRIAVAKPGMGLARKMLDWAFECTGTMRIDTHCDNVIMQHVLLGYGFKRCGVIYLANGAPRDAYMLTKEQK